MSRYLKLHLNSTCTENWRVGRILAGLFFLMPTFQITQVHAQERPFYSIHVASFDDLHAAGRHVYELRSKEKIVFWKEFELPGNGILYRVYIGKYGSKEQAVTAGNRLNHGGKVSYFGVHRFNEPLLPQAPPAGSSPEIPEQSGKQKSAPAANRFIDHGDGTVTDKATGLMWAKNGWLLEFLGAATWQDAIRKCEGFGLGKHTDWRLPTIEEWKTLIDTGKQCPALVEPNPFNNMIVHMPYWSRTEFIYGIDYTCIEVCPIKAYTVDLYFGHIQNRNKNERAFILPVRNVR